MKYRRKHGTIEALQYDGTLKGAQAIVEWTLGAHHRAYLDQKTFRTEYTTTTVTALKIRTDYGDLVVLPNDFVLKNITGHHFPCKPHEFHKEYEKI